MNIVNYSERPPGRVNESWLKALARRLRDWLNGFLVEPGRFAVDGGHAQGGAPSSSVSEARSAQHPQEAEEISGSRDQTEVAPEGRVGDAGPPEAWLALVRERAPELLLPVEEGGTPWQEMISEAMQEKKDKAEVPLVGRVEDAGPPEAWLALVRERAPGLLLPVEEGKPAEEKHSPPTARVPPAEVQSSPEERVREGAAPARSNSRTPRKTPWLQSLGRKLWPGLSASVPEEEKSPPRQERVASLLAAQQQPAKPAGQSAPAATVRWGERIRQKIQGVLHSSPTSVSLSKSKAAEKEKTKQQTHEQNAESSSPRTIFPSARGAKFQFLRSVRQVTQRSIHESISSSTSPRAEVLPSDSRLDRSSSEPPATFSSSARPFGGVKRSPSQGDVLASITNPKRWPPLPETAENPAAPIKETATGGREQGKPGRHMFPTAPLASDVVQPDSRGSAKFEPDDRWPELPEDQPAPSARLLGFVRDSERLRALDREQSGGR